MSSRYVKKYVPLQQNPFVRDNRTEIFESKVTDKNLIQRNKLKTAMCKRMVDTGKCQYGESCFFAHHQSEIRKPICFFGEDCKNKNSCPYDHTTEVIPEMVPPPKKETVSEEQSLTLKKTKHYYDPLKPLPKDFKIEFEDEVPNTFQVYSNQRCYELEMLKSLMKQAEDNIEFQTVMCDTLREFMSNTFTKENTHFIPSNNVKKNKIKFIAVECDDEEFDTLKEVIKESFVEEEN